MATASPEVRALARELAEARARIAALEAELAAARRLESLGRLTGSIAHDFSNVVAAIAGYTELMCETLPAEGVLRRRADSIRKATEWGQRLARELVAAGRPRAAEPPAADLNAVVGGVVRTLGPLLGAGVEVTLDLDPGVGAVGVAVGPLEQVTMNLLLNARDAMPAGGRLTVSSAAGGVNGRARPMAVLRVADTGVGMDETTRARAFEPYFTTKPEGKGTGLGLSTVFGIVTQHGGHIDIASEPGRGSTFTITLPRVGDAVRAAAQRVPPTVLVVEQEPGVRELIVEILELHDFRALSASDPREARRVSAAHEGPLALVIADAGGPGEPVAQRLAGLAAARPEARVLYLTKPFGVDALVQTVREALGETPSG